MLIFFTLPNAQKSNLAIIDPHNIKINHFLGKITKATLETDNFRQLNVWKYEIKLSIAYEINVNMLEIAKNFHAFYPDKYTTNCALIKCSESSLPFNETNFYLA